MNTERLKVFIKKEFDMDYIGVCAASSLAGEPAGRRPEDILPGAKSVIVFGRRLVDGAIQALFRTYENGKAEARATYGAYAAELAPNILMVDATNNIAAYLEDTTGCASAPVTFAVQQDMVWEQFPAPYFTDPYAQGMPLNIWQAAMAAGIGEYGWSNRFLTPEDGPRVMLSAVITAAELEPDSPYSGPALCDPEKCGVCAKMCPTGAISACKSCEKAVEGKSVKVAEINPRACAVAALGFRKEFYGRSADLIEGNDPTVEEINAALAKKPLALDAAVNHYARYLCERCLIYCPTGRWKERFYDTGLTKVEPPTD